MFPMDEELKQKVLWLVGSKLNTGGDNYEKGSAFISKASQVLNELESKYLFDIGLPDPNYDAIRTANGLKPPKVKKFQPVLGKLTKRQEEMGKKMKAQKSELEEQGIVNL